MELTFNEADFLMHCIDSFTEYQQINFMDDEMKQVLLDPGQINDLFLRIQNCKFASSRI